MIQRRIQPWTKHQWIGIEYEMTQLTAKQAHLFFEHVVRHEVFPDELNSVASGEKAMSVLSFAVPHDSAPTNSRELNLLLKQCSSKGLSVEVESDTREGEGSHVKAYVFQEPQRWRVEAYRLLWSSHAGRNWSDAAESMEASLLGYPMSAIRQRLRDNSLTSAGWGLRTYYIALPMNGVSALARGFGRVVPIVGRSWSLFSMSSYLAPRSRWPASMMTTKLARFGCLQISMKRLLENSVRDTCTKRGNLLWVFRTSAAVLEYLYPFMRSNIELWTDGQWKTIGA